MSGSKEVTEVRTVRTREEVISTIGKFLRNKEATKKQIASRLKEIKTVFESSQFFKNREVMIQFSYSLQCGTAHFFHC